MTENVRTAVFALLGVVFLVLAWAARPAAPTTEAIDDSGERFFEPFDPLDASALEIVTFDEDLGLRDTFRVHETGEVWTIPSHDDYPADARDHLGLAAAAVMDLVKGPKVSDRRGDHELYGVVDPAEADAGASGVGTRVKMAAGVDDLVDIIIGETVKDRPHLHYVRVPGIDRVYTAEVSTEELTTRFEDWIEGDLLLLDPNAVTNVMIDDYSIDEVNQRMVQGDRLMLRHDAQARTWDLDGLGEDEALDKAPLDAMKRALDDARIVDVLPKPAGLSAELRAEGDMQLDSGAVSSLAGHGFYIVQGRLLSNEGDLYVGLHDGVEYVLRFGEIALDSREGELIGADDAGEDITASSANRYLFVMAQFNEALVPEPEYQPVPEVPEAVEGADEEAAARDEAVRRALEQARQDAVAENDLLRAEHESSLEAGRRRVTALNDRFADWYYVIPNDVYTQVRLRRDALVTPVEAEAVEGPAPPGS